VSEKDTGELYTWGIGPLGHKGSSNPIKPKPEKVLGALEYKVVISIACGREHMACVTGTYAIEPFQQYFRLTSWQRPPSNALARDRRRRVVHLVCYCAQRLNVDARHLAAAAETFLRGDS
jgi:hypothetical protein